MTHYSQTRHIYLPIKETYSFLAAILNLLLVFMRGLKSLIMLSDSKIMCTYSLPLESDDTYQFFDAFMWRIIMYLFCCMNLSFIFVALMYASFVTGRNEVVAKVIFLHLSVIHSVHRGGLPQCMLGYHPLPPQSRPPWEQMPPRSRHPPEQTPPRPDPPWEQTPSLPSPPEQTPPGTRPPGTKPPGPDPPGPDTPQDQTPPGSRHPPREADCSIRSTSGRYASYWNAFLFFLKFVYEKNWNFT